MARSRIERKKFYPGPGLEPGLLVFRANVITKSAIQDRINFFRVILNKLIFNINSLSRRNTKYPFIYCHSRV